MAERFRVLRGQHWGEKLCALLQRPPADISGWMLQHTRLVKNDTYSLAGLLQLDGKECFLKFYRYKSSLRKMLPVLGDRRAVHSFKVSQTLVSTAVPVPEALSCLRIAEGSLLLTAGIPCAISLGQLWRQQPSSQETGLLMCESGKLIASLHRSGFVHGDCKWSNLLQSAERLYLVDLDAAATATRRRPYARDIARFTLNAEEQAVASRHYEQFLSSYLEHVGESRETVVQQALPYLRTFRERHQARYGSCGSPLL